MHQKKSEVQIGTESSGVSSDFNPIPPLLFPFSSSIHQNQQQQHVRAPDSNSFIVAVSPTSTTSPVRNHFSNNNNNNNSVLSKRPLIHPSAASLVKSPTLHSLIGPFSSSSTPSSSLPTPNSRGLGFRFIKLKSRCPSINVIVSVTRSAGLRVLKRLKQLRYRIRCHVRIVFFLVLPFFYFLVSNPSRSVVLDFLSAVAFSAALLLSLNLALPRLPSIRVWIPRSFPFPIRLKCRKIVNRGPLPVFWSIGSRGKSEKRLGEGCWVLVYSNGDAYEGEFYKGKCSGSGVYYYYMSGRYEGDWIDGKYDGHGVETWARGSRYRGQYRQGLRHGYGVYRFYTGDVYAGEWSNGQSHGCGIHTCEDGSRYVGEFKWGVKHGLGHYHFRNGDAYAGEYFADKMHGFGIYKFANGHCYEGSWHEGGRQGLGMYTFRNGETQAGHWHNGILDVPSTQNIVGPVSPIGVNHSKVLNAVQEARRSAKRAYDIAKVDERVNRAVSAANRAANAARVAAIKAVQKQMHQDTSHSLSLSLV
ncbi:Phosphatidylinositol 4-phosphate 5-kinase 5-like protein [Drosera capensis]